MENQNQDEELVQKRKEYFKNYNSQNQEKRKEYLRDWRSKNQDYFKQYYQKHHSIKMQCNICNKNFSTGYIKKHKCKTI